ncbi:MAG: histone deacetylase [Candidatus Binatia bacterium]|nr:histone deacetylase [Candidatus Binatia bacterium]
MSHKTSVLIDSRFQEHDPGRGHPERPDRIAVLEDLLGSWSGPSLERITPRLAAPDEIQTAHTESLFERIRETEGLERAQIDPDTATSARSYEVALLAAGGLLEVVDAVADGATGNAFAFVRPPGHHATASQSMGFCLFNNVAVAAKHLRAVGFDRVAIVDFDLHHGNGTEAIFYDDPSVLYASLHQYPYYPGTGAADDLGSDAGKGFTVNVPFSAGVGDTGYLLAFDQILSPVLRQFQPDFLLVSAGFDCHRRDPLGGMQVTEEGVIGMTRRLLDVARDVCGGKVAAVLEGGYDLDAIRSSAEAMLIEMATAPEAPEPVTEDADTDMLEPLKDILRPYWEL